MKETGPVDVLKIEAAWPVPKIVDGQVPTPRIPTGIHENTKRAYRKRRSRMNRAVLAPAGGPDREIEHRGTEDERDETSFPLLKTHGPYFASFRPGSHLLPHEGIVQLNTGDLGS